ncbi:MAG: hypothetical protein ABSE73_23580 [Planctomycetota bacterium]
MPAATASKTAHSPGLDTQPVLSDFDSPPCDAGRFGFLPEHGYINRAF